MYHTGLHGRTAFWGRKKGFPVPFWAMESADGIVEGAETVTGSYRTPSGTPGGAVHGPRTVPTASGSARACPAVGKGLTPPIHKRLHTRNGA